MNSSEKNCKPHENSSLQNTISDLNQKLTHLESNELKIIQLRAMEEHDRAIKAKYVNDALSVLAIERDLPTALEKIMSLCCDALDAQWCYAGRWENGAFHIVQSYAAPGEKILFNPGETIEYITKFNDASEYHGRNDFVPMDDFKNHPAYGEFVRVATHPDIMRQVSSGFSHIVRFHGKPWGSIMLMFRRPHNLTNNEESFFKSFAHGVELSLVRKGYEEEIAAEKAREVKLEQDRVDKQRRINESLEVLLGESDLHTALEQIMSMWCEALGAQWCYIGKYNGSVYTPFHSYAVPGEQRICEPGVEIPVSEEMSKAFLVDQSADYFAYPDFRQNPVAETMLKLTPNKNASQAVTSLYRHAIKFDDNQTRGSLVLIFRDRHVLTPSEEGFFKASAKGIELAFERNRQILELKNERDRALSAEKAKSLFFSSVSHDIRTPLNAIVGFSELLEAGVEDEATRNRYIATIRSSSKVLSRLVNDILDLSKLESGKLMILNEPTDVPKLVHEVSDAFGVARQHKQILFSADIAPMPRISIDPQRLRQILYNLLSNAHKYTDKGSIRLSSTWKDGTLTLAVTDTGMGISKEDIERVLQPFVQVVDRNHRNGTGLGLPICQRLARLMGGELNVESELGKGSTFSVTFTGVKVIGDSPTGVAAAHDNRATAVAAQPKPRARRVLAVDDSPVNLMVIKAMLARCGITDVVTAVNGKEALDILSSDPSFDAVLTDYWMPEMDGEGLVRALRQIPSFASLPVYLLTADVEAVKHHREIGFTGILLKPLTQASVRALLA